MPHKPTFGSDPAMSAGPPRLGVGEHSLFKHGGLYQGNKRFGFKLKTEKEPGDREAGLHTPQRPFKVVRERSFSPTTLPSHRAPFGFQTALSAKTCHTLDTMLPNVPAHGITLEDVKMSPTRPTLNSGQPIWSDQTIPTDQLSLPLLQPFLRLTSNKMADDHHSDMSDQMSQEDRPPRPSNPPNVELPEDVLVGETSLLDSPARTMTADELMEMYLDEFDSVEIKQLSRGYSAMQPRQLDPVLSLPTLLHRCESGKDAMEIERDDSDHLSETKLSTARAVPQSGLTCCTCKRSKCLKLYCECFRSNGFCSAGCTCTECYNRAEYADVRDQFFAEQLQRNPSSFSSKILTLPGTAIYAKGCNCKKTECLKNYCECFAAKVKCSHLCRCTECQNFDPSAGVPDCLLAREQQVKKRRKSEKNFQQSLKERLTARKVTTEGRVPPAN